MKAIEPGKQVEFICKSERDLDKKEQTIFLVEYLTASENAKLRDDLYDVTGAGKARKETLKTGTVELKALRMGLKGWKNFTDAKGEQISFNIDKIDDMIDMIPPEARSEIADFIRGESALDEGE